MREYTIEQYYDHLRLETNRWLTCIASIMRSITKEVMDHHIDSTMYDNKTVTMNIDVPCIDYSIHMRGRGYAFKNSRSFMIKYRGINTLLIKINNKEQYCTVENCYLSKSMYTNGIIRDIDYMQVLTHILALVDEIHEDYPNVTIVNLEERVLLIELTNTIINLFNKTVEA